MIFIGLRVLLNPDNPGFAFLHNMRRMMKKEQEKTDTDTRSNIQTLHFVICYLQQIGVYGNDKPGNHISVMRIDRKGRVFENDTIC